MMFLKNGLLNLIGTRCGKTLLKLNMLKIGTMMLEKMIQQTP